MAQNENPKVTVIIPTYKRTVEFLSRAVLSVANQTYDNIEIIVIDDSPESYEHRNDIKDYMNSVSSERIQYYQNEKNMGGSLARNRGISLAHGSFISFLDDDDEYNPEKLSKQVQFMLEGDYDLTFSDMIMYSTSGTVVDYRDYKDIPAFDNESLLHYHLMRHMTGTPTFMFKTEKLREIGGFEDAKMGAFVADKAVKKMIEAEQAPKKSKVVILGLTFKENCPDTRNSKVDDIIKQLNTYGIEPVVVDPWASERDAMHEYGVTLTKIEDVADADCVIVAVAHNEFRALSLADIKKLFKAGDDSEKVLIDVKGLYKVEDLKESGMQWWRL